MNFKIIRDLLFLLPTETSHHLSLQSIGLLHQLKLSSFLARPMVLDPVEVMGIQFPNRVGLAAGLDKDARYIDGLAALGFGFLEVGTVTPLPQPGSPKPRLFRIPSQRAIINRMGFNNEGLDAMTRRIRRSNYDGVLGINIGKNKNTPMENTLDDYLIGLRKVYKQASYVVINVSSPNTQGLRSLQHGDELAGLLAGLKEAHEELQKKYQKYVPLVVKIAPDMDDEDILQVTRRLIEFEIDGVIVSNTTVSRSAINGERHAEETGGLSGAPLTNQSNHVLKITAEQVKDKMAIIGVGGVMSADDACEKIRLGADLVQLYTGFIYEGPELIESSAKKIAAQFS